MVTLAPLEAGAFVVAARFLAGMPAFALGDGSVLVLSGAGERRIPVHRGGLLAAEGVLAGDAMATGGGDGRVCLVTVDGQVRTLAELPRKWIDQVACGPQGAVAFAAGRTAYVVTGPGEPRAFPLDRAVGGIAFAPKGLRLAIARYDGATLVWANAGGVPQELAWKGAHTGVTFSPDGAYLVTTMQENALHGWRLSDGQDMRMTGYPSKVKSTSWSARGRYLATAGANGAICWPFFGRNGPMGQEPLQLGLRGDQLATRVACHPAEEVVAIGYQDGMILLVRFSDAQEVLLRRPAASPVSALGWDAGGTRLVFGTEAGEAGVITLG